MQGLHCDCHLQAMKRNHLGKSGIATFNSNFHFRVKLWQQTTFGAQTVRTATCWGSPSRTASSKCDWTASICVWTASTVNDGIAHARHAHVPTLTPTCPPTVFDPEILRCGTNKYN